MRGWIVVLALLVSSITTRAADVTAPDFAALRAAGKATAEKLALGPATEWRVTAGINGLTLTADVLESPGVRRINFSLKAPAAPAPSPVGRLIETPRVWYYADPNGRRRKHRPHEVELPMTMFGLLREFADLRAITGDDLVALGRFVARDGDIARYATPAPNEPALRAVLAQVEKLTKDDPAGAAKNPQIAKQAADIRRLLDQGVPLAVDVRTGVMTEFVAGNVAYKVAGLRHLVAVPRDEPNPELLKWEDFTDDPTVTAKPNDLVMLGHAPFWKPGGPDHDPDAVLLDLASGRVRRIPFEGVAAAPGCFLRGRTGVVVAGMDVVRGGLQLFTVDLRTGANRPLGGAALDDGITLMPALSPDGKSVAALHKAATGPILATQVVVIDLATDQVRKVGAPVDGAFLNWLPDGSGFVLLMSKDADPNTKEPRRICRMGLDGTVTTLCDGREPVVLPTRKAIAFQGADRGWQMCDLDGANPRPLDTGGGRFSFASASPDDGRLIMIGFGGKNGPAPALYDLSAQTQQFLTLPPGLWSTPAWR